jgi:ribosomal protein L29
MKASKLREHSEVELRQLCGDTRRSISEWRAKKGIGEASEQPLRIRTTRRGLARILTVMKERGVGEHA